MLIDQEPYLKIFFGNKTHGWHQPQEFYGIQDPQKLAQVPRLINITQELEITHLCTVKQTHSVIGHRITNINQATAYAHEGDYLITNVFHIGLAISTADCMPVIIYDPQHHVIAAIHAGWQGTMNQIITHAIQDLCATFTSNPASLRIWIGPSARSCCYEVTEEFIAQHQHIPHIISAITYKQHQLFLDLPSILTAELLDNGITPKNIVRTSNICTICNPEFCSHRRDKEKAARQMTIVTLCG
jgi:hypothetical protein